MARRTSASLPMAWALRKALCLFMDVKCASIRSAQGMLTVGERQRYLLTVRSERREDGQRQLDGLKSSLWAAEGIALLFDGRKQVTHGTMVSTVDEPDVLASDPTTGVRRFDW